MSPSQQKQRLTFLRQLKLKFRQYFLNSNDTLTWENWKNSKTDFLQKGLMSATGAAGIFFKLLIAIKDVPIFLIGGIAVLIDEIGHSILSKCLSIWHDRLAPRSVLFFILLIPVAIGLALRVVGSSMKLACNLLFNPFKTAEAAQALFDKISKKFEEFFENTTAALKDAIAFSPKGFVAGLLFLISLLITWLVVKPIAYIGRGLKLPYLISLLLSGVALFFAGKALLAGIGLLGAAGIASTIAHAITVAASTLYTFAAAHLPFLVAFDLHFFGAHVGALMTPIIVATLPFHLNEVSTKIWEGVVGVKDYFSGEAEEKAVVSSRRNSQTDILNAIKPCEKQQAARDQFKRVFDAQQMDEKHEDNPTGEIQVFISRLWQAVNAFQQEKARPLNSTEQEAVCTHLAKFAEPLLQNLNNMEELTAGSNLLNGLIDKLNELFIISEHQETPAIIQSCRKMIGDLRTAKEQILAEAQPKPPHKASEAAGQSHDAENPLSAATSSADDLTATL